MVASAAGANAVGAFGVFHNESSANRRGAVDVPGGVTGGTAGGVGAVGAGTVVVTAGRGPAGALTTSTQCLRRRAVAHGVADEGFTGSAPPRIECTSRAETVEPPIVSACPDPDPNAPNMVDEQRAVQSTSHTPRFLTAIQPRGNLWTVGGDQSMPR
jgi:hypothetical protein